MLVRYLFRALINLMRGPAPEKVEVAETTDTPLKLTPLKVPIPGAPEESKDTSAQQVAVYNPNSGNDSKPNENEVGTPESSGAERTSGETSGDDEVASRVRRSEGLEAPAQVESILNQAVALHAEPPNTQEAAGSKIVEEAKGTEPVEEPPAVSQV